jgi:hypothetical protein
MKEPGSVEWCYQTANALQYLWTRAEPAYERYLEILREADEHRIWEKVPPDSPYGSRAAFLQAIGIGNEDAVERRRQEMEIMALTVGPSQKHGTNQHTREGGCAHEHNLKWESNSAKALTARIARDRPDILERMKVGEFLSARQAAIAAGIINPQRKHELPHDPSRAAEFLKKWFTQEDLAKIVRALASD